MKKIIKKMKRMGGIVLSLLLIVDFVLLAGIAEVKADPESTVNGSNPSDSTLSTTDSESITVSVLTNFVEVTSVTSIEELRVKKTDGKLRVAMIPQKYAANDVIMRLPDGSALVDIIGTAEKNTISHTTTDLTGLSNGDIEVLDVIDSGTGFDTCKKGSIKYLKSGIATSQKTNTSFISSYVTPDDAWYYNCGYGGVHNVGPFYVYTYDTTNLTYTKDNVKIEFKEGFSPLFSSGTISKNSVEAVIELDDDTIYKVPSVELTDATVDPANNDYTITVKVGVGDKFITKELKAAVTLEDEDVAVSLKSSVYTGAVLKKLSKDDVNVVVTIDEEEYKTSEFTFIDDVVDPLNGDTTIKISCGGVEKVITAAVPITADNLVATVRTGRYSGTSSKTFGRNDIKLVVRADNTEYEVTDFTFIDNVVDPINDDTTITISCGGIEKRIVAARSFTGNVTSNGSIGVKELIAKAGTMEATRNSVLMNNSLTAVEAAVEIMETEKLEKYVDEAINLGDTSVDVKKDGTAQKLAAKVNTMDSSVVKNALTPEEILRVLAGERIDLRLEVVVDETSDAKDTTGGQLIESELNSNESAYYFTADLYKIFNDDEDNKSSITEFSDAISFTIDIPEEIRNEGRTFTLVASHELADGTFETFNLVDIDDDDATFTASTTKLCTMALVYADQEVVEAPVIEAAIIEPEVVLNDGDVSPQTADLRNVLWTFIITVSAGAVLVVAFRKEFQ